MTSGNTATAVEELDTSEDEGQTSLFDVLRGNKFCGTGISARSRGFLSVALILSATSVTAIKDYWVPDTIKTEAQTVNHGIKKPIGRRISRGEALRISQEIQERAERERNEFAEREARGGIQWDKET